MAVQITVRVRGLRDVDRTLSRIRRDAPAEARAASQKVAQLVVRNARPRVPIGPAAGGHVKSSVRVVDSSRGAQVSGGGRRFPYFPWLVRGGAVGRNHRVRRRFVPAGRYIWPAYLQTRARAEAILRDHLDRLARGGR